MFFKKSPQAILISRINEVAPEFGGFSVDWKGDSYHFTVWRSGSINYHKEEHYRGDVPIITPCPSISHAPIGLLNAMLDDWDRIEAQLLRQKAQNEVREKEEIKKKNEKNKKKHNEELAFEERVRRKFLGKKKR